MNRFVKRTGGRTSKRTNFENWKGDKPGIETENHGAAEC